MPPSVNEVLRALIARLVCRSAMERFEPAMLDMYGATWSAEHAYTLQPGARRYEIYEKNFAGMVSPSSTSQLPGTPVAIHDQLDHTGQACTWSLSSFCPQSRALLVGCFYEKC